MKIMKIKCACCDKEIRPDEPYMTRKPGGDVYCRYCWKYACEDAELLRIWNS